MAACTFLPQPYDGTVMTAANAMTASLLMLCFMICVIFYGYILLFFVPSSPPPSSCPDWDGCKYTSYSTFTKIFSPQTHTPFPFPLRNILPANLHPPPFFAPCPLTHAGVPHNYISESMGHSVDSNITNRYIDAFPLAQQMEFNSRLLKLNDDADIMEELKGLTTEQLKTLIALVKKS